MDTLERLRALAVREFSIDPASLDPRVPLESLGIDSLAFIDFMFKVEEEFGVSVSDEDLKGIRTLGALESHLAHRLADAGKA
jgi:acyl carrier protein